MTSIRLDIHRLAHGRIVIEDALQLAREVLHNDPSSTSPTGFDARAGQPPHTRITDEDVAAIRSTMRVRGKKKPWLELPGLGHIAELAALDPAWDLFGMPDSTWNQKARPALVEAIGRFNLIDSFGPAKITKLLALKRPLFVPPVDSYVMEMIGARIPQEREQRDRRPEAIATTIGHLREQGIANLPALRAIQTAAGVDRALPRILDVLLWGMHPASPFSRRGHFTMRWAAGSTDGTPR